MKSFASEVNCRIMVYEKPTAILAWLLGGEAFRELLGTDQWRAKRRWPSQQNTSQPRHQRGILMDDSASGLNVHPRLSHEASGQRTRRLTTCVGPCNVQR